VLWDPGWRQGLNKAHDEGELDKDALHLMYPRGGRAYYGKVKNLYMYYATLKKIP
jgi:hypothetical protein